MTRKKLGVTLIELMIVVAIVGILAAFAYPSYQGYLEAGRRETAREFIMLDVLKAQSTYLAANSQFTNSFQTLGYGASVKFQDDFYEYELSYPGGKNNKFQVRAIPINNHSDTTCGYLEFEMPGYKTRSQKSTAKNCWKVEL